MSDRPDRPDEPAAPGWTAPSAAPDGAPGPLSSGWAAEQPPVAYAPPPAPQGWGPVGPPPIGPGGPGGPGAPGAAPGAGPTWTPAPPPLRPGVIPLRPLGVGEILDGAISAIRAKPRIMLGLSAVVAVITQVLTVPITWLLLHDIGDISFTGNSSSAGTSAEANLGLTASALSASGVQILVTLAATLLLTGVLTIVLSKAVLGQDIEAADAWAQTRPRIKALVGVTALVAGIEVGLSLLTIGPGVALALAGAPGAAVTIALVLGIAAWLVVGVYLYTAFALAPAVIVLERAAVVKSLRRSRALVRGAWWRTFAILLLVNVLARVLAGIIAVPFSLLGIFVAYVQGSSDSLNPYGVLPLLVTAVGSILASTIAWPFTSVSIALLYVDRRIRREALDISLARAAGLVPAGTSATPGTPLSPPTGPTSGGTYGGPTPPYSG
jgi:hypothetical protein